MASYARRVAALFAMVLSLPVAGQSVAELRAAAARGDADAQAHLSWAYHMGAGVKADDAEAVKWERLAAAKGQASAQYYLGSDYEFGLGGLPKDIAKAAVWYRRAAEHDHPIAQARLGDLYAAGLGVPRDDREAIAWYVRASLQGDFRAELGLGRMCAAGRGMPKDEARALEWFQRAADQENMTALSVIGDEPPLSPALKRDYGFAMLAERQPASPGAVVERDRLAAKLRAQEPAPAAVPPATAEEFCPRLADVMAAATENFAALRDKKIEPLPGMRSCVIETAGNDDDAPPFTYRCTVAEDVDAALAAAGRDGTKQLVSRCLGESWRVVERPLSRDVVVLFSNPKSPLRLELLQIELLSKYSVTLGVAAPMAPLTLVRSREGGATDLDSPVDFKSEKAGLGNVVHEFAVLLGADLLVDAGMKGKVSFDRKNVPVHEALDAVCAQARCAWSFHRGQKRAELYIQRHATPEK